MMFFWGDPKNSATFLEYPTTRTSYFFHWVEADSYLDRSVLPELVLMPRNIQGGHHQYRAAQFPTPQGMLSKTKELTAAEAPNVV